MEGKEGTREKENGTDSEEKRRVGNSKIRYVSKKNEKTGSEGNHTADKSWWLAGKKGGKPESYLVTTAGGRGQQKRGKWGKC